MLFLSCQESLTFYLLVVFQNSDKLIIPVGGSGLNKISNNNLLVHLKKGWQVGLTRNWARCFDNNENETKCAISSNTWVFSFIQYLSSYIKNPIFKWFTWQLWHQIHEHRPNHEQPLYQVQPFHHEQHPKNKHTIRHDKVFKLTYKKLTNPLIINALAK